MPGWLFRLTANPVLRQGVRIYFLSKAPLTAAFHYLLALGAILFVIWPKSQFLRIGSPPLTFNIVAIVAMLVMAYLSFGYGASSLVEEPEQSMRTWVVAQRLRPGMVLGGLIWLTLSHTLFLLVLALPLLQAASHVSGLAPQSFGTALLLMLVCTLAYRWVGIVTLCLWEGQEFIRYVVVRAAFVLLVLGSAFFLPALNPLMGLISMTFGDELGQIVTLFGQELSYAAVSLIIHLLLLMAAYIMVSTLVRRWFTEVSTQASRQG
jgi:hypothetical protein